MPPNKKWILCTSLGRSLAGSCHKEAFPELYSFTKHKQISLQKALQGNLADLFHTPLSEQAYSQFLQVQTIFQSINQQDENDKWSYI
jgi:hypothetical protein